MINLNVIFKIFTIIALFFFKLSHAEYSKNDVKIENFKDSDHYYLLLARDRINEKSQRYFGSNLNGEKNYDLKLLQRIFDYEYKNQYSQRTWQDMGVILGETLTRNHAIKWVIYIDHLGISRALQIKNSFDFLFPITMISRRAEADIRVNIFDLYQAAEEKIKKIEERTKNIH